jgi:AraC-like DNA-binding protein
VTCSNSFTNFCTALEPNLAHSALGLDIAGHFDPSALGPAYRYILSGKTVGSMAERLVKSSRAIDSGLSFAIREDEGEFFLLDELYWQSPLSLGFITTFSLGMVTAIIKRTIGSRYTPPQRVYFREPLSDEALAHASDYFGCEVYSGAPIDGLVLSKAQWLEENPNPGSEGHAPELANPSMGQMVYRIVEREIGRMEVTAASLASRLGLPERTLRHRLQCEQTSLNRIFALSRCRKALSLLANGHSVSDASDSVKLSSPQALCRLYSREMGVSPQKHLRKIQNIGIKVDPDPGLDQAKSPE